MLYWAELRDFSKAGTKVGPDQLGPPLRVGLLPIWRLKFQSKMFFFTEVFFTAGVSYSALQSTSERVSECKNRIRAHNETYRNLFYFQ